MRYLLFGTGDCYNRYRVWFDRDEVVALLDNSPNKQGEIIDGIPVMSPAQGVTEEFDAVVILSFYVNSMKEQLIRLGVDEASIYHFYDIHRLKGTDYLLHPIRKYGETEDDNKGKRVLLLNQNLSVGGPALTLFDCARVLKKNGYHPVYGSMVDGPLKEKLLGEGIPVVIDENMLIGTMRDAKWIKNYDMVFCNAINFYYFLSSRDENIPCIWWLHDSKFFYEGVDKKIITSISNENLEVLSVGRVAKEALTLYAPQLNPHYFLYGTDDVAVRYKKRCMNRKIRFITLGFVEDRKGQDILAKAVLLLDQDIRELCEFYIVGKNTSAMAQELMKTMADISEIVYTGMVDDVHEYIVDSNVLICASREDPMPAACAESMMHSVPCIVTDAAGTAEFITNRENGLVFKSEDAVDLSEKISWCVRNSDKLESMGKNARKIYDDYFRMDSFEANLMRVITKSMNGDGIQ